MIRLEKNGQYMDVKGGFSWTVLFFGPLALLIRGQILLAIIDLLVYFTILPHIIWCFFVNSQRLNSFYNDGWKRV